MLWRDKTICYEPPSCLSTLVASLSETLINNSDFSGITITSLRPTTWREGVASLGDVWDMIRSSKGSEGKNPDIEMTNSLQMESARRGTPRLPRRYNLKEPTVVDGSVCRRAWKARKPRVSLTDGNTNEWLSVTAILLSPTMAARTAANAAPWLKPRTP